MKKISTIIFIFISSFFIFSINAFADDEVGSVDEKYSEQWRYDINSLEIDNNMMTIVGWATLKGYVDKNNELYMTNTGIYTGSDKNKPTLDKSPQYQLKLVGSDGSEFGPYKYQATEPSGFSVTCPLYYVVGTSCFSALNNGGFDSRNSLSGIKLHDNTDFKFEIDISDLKPNIDYHIEMVISTDEFTTNWKTIQVLESDVTNKSNNSYNVNTINTVKMLATGALKQDKNISAFEGGHSIGGYFDANKVYNVKNISVDKSIASSLGVKYRYYQLSDPDNPDDTAWAYSAWVEIYSDFKLTTIEKNDPCDDPDYAKKNMNECCNPSKEIKYSEACCGYEDYIKSDVFRNDEFAKSVCCLNSKSYTQKYSALDNREVTFDTFRKYLNMETFVNTDLINNICSNSEKNYGKNCPTKTSKINDSTSYNIDYLQVNMTNGEYVNFKEHSKTIDVTINLKRDPNKTLTVDDIAYDYFTSEDFTNYIDTNKDNKNIIFTEKKYSVYALNKDDFDISINSLTKVTNKQYKISITLTLDEQLSTNNRLPVNNPITNNLLGKDVFTQNTGAYFLPFKIWLCDSSSNGNDNDDGGDDCSSTQYFNNNKAYCCSKDEYKNSSKCLPNDECSGESCNQKIPEYGWDNNVGCSNNYSSMKQRNVNIGSNNFCSIICTDNVKLEDYPTLDNMKQNILKPGAGFEYGMNIKNFGTCTINYNSTIYASEEALNTAITNCNDLLEDYRYSSEKYKTKVLTNQTIKIENKDQYKYEYQIISNNFEPSQYSLQFMYWDSCSNGFSTYPCIKYSEKNVNRFYFEYNYSANIVNQYIKKSNSSDVKNDKINDDNYVDGGNKYYPSITDSGTYTFKVNFKNLGLTKQISSNDFTCQYLIANNPIPIPDPICKDPPCPGPNDGEGSYYFRPISLTNPFPNNRDIGSNWLGNAKNSTNSKINEYIYKSDGSNNNGNSVYYSNDPLYEITLDSNTINYIKQYNKQTNYLDWENMNQGQYNKFDQTSSFLDGLKYNYELKTKLSDEDRKKKIGDF